MLIERVTVEQCTSNAVLRYSDLGMATKRSWRDFALDTSSMDCARLLRPWSWLLSGKNLRPVAMTLFGDWILANEQGVHLLDLVGGAVVRIASDMTEFERLAEEDARFEEWFIPDLVLELRDSGIVLKPDECYSYVVPPVIGGKIAPENIKPAPIMVQQTWMGQIHEQARQMPPGTRITGIDVDWE